MEQTGQTTIEGAAHGGLILSNYKWLSTEPSPFHAASKEVVMKRLQMLSELPAQEPFESRLCACMCTIGGTSDQVPITPMQRTRCGSIQPGHQEFWARAVVFTLSLVLPLAVRACALYHLHSCFCSILPSHAVFMDFSHTHTDLTLSCGLSPSCITTRCFVLVSTG